MAPRNANNMIVKGNRYELMYYDCSWKSAGKQVAKDNYLIFQDVPSNTLYWLKTWITVKKNCLSFTVKAYNTS